MTEGRFCPTCGKPVLPEERFCGACGANLASDPVPETHAAKPEKPARRGKWVLASSLAGIALFLGVAAISYLEAGASTPPAVAVSDPVSNPEAAVEAPRANVSTTPVPVTDAPVHPVMEINVIAWHFSPPEPTFIDLPSLMSEIDYDPANDLTQLTFVCQPDAAAPVFYVLIAAPGFTEAETIDIAISFDDDVEPLRLTLEDLYASGAGAPAIDWDARILYAPADQMALAPLFEAPSLTVVAGDRAWRMGTAGMGEAASAFLGACWGER